MALLCCDRESRKYLPTVLTWRILKVKTEFYGYISQERIINNIPWVWRYMFAWFLFPVRRRIPDNYRAVHSLFHRFRNLSDYILGYNTQHGWKCKALDQTWMEALRKPLNRKSWKTVAIRDALCSGFESWLYKTLLPIDQIWNYEGLATFTFYNHYKFTGNINQLLGIPWQIFISVVCQSYGNVHGVVCDSYVSGRIRFYSIDSEMSIWEK